MEIISGKHLLRKTQGWIVYFDVFGFKALVNSGADIKHILYSLMDCHEKLSQTDLKGTCDRLHFAFSDSIILAFPEVKAINAFIVLRECVEIVQDILNLYLSNNLTLRGGMAFGDFTYSSNNIVGSTYIRAYEYESSIIAPLVYLPYNETEFCTEVSGERPVTHEVETKSGVREGKLFFPFPFDEYKEVVDRNVRYYKASGPDNVAFAWKKAQEYIENLKKEITCE